MGDFDWDSDFRRMQGREGSIIIRDLAFTAVAYEHAALEEMVERSLTAPERCGIAIVITKQTEFDPVAENLYRAISERSYRLDPNVPFGHIYEFPSMEAYEVWQERGCPGPV